MKVDTLQRRKMDSTKRSLLSDEDMLFALVTALVKRAGGEIKISEDEMDGIKSSDMVMMYYDESEKEIILTNHILTTGFEDEVF